MTMSLRRHDKSFMNNIVLRSVSSSECRISALAVFSRNALYKSTFYLLTYRRREVTARMWRAAEDCSERQRLEKLGRRRLRVEYGEQTARETKRNADAFETLTVLDDVHWRETRDMTVPGHEDIIRTASLNSIRQEIVSQCSWRRCGVMWSNFDDEKTSRATAFITDCKHRTRCNGMPASIQLQ